MRTHRSYLLALLFVIAGTATAQLGEQIVPANPTTSNLVRLRFDWTTFGEPIVTRVGNHFTVEVQYCMILCPTSTFYVPLGTLPAGSYTYEIVAQGNPAPLASGAFVVTAGIPEAPALSAAALAALCAFLAGVGWILLGRRS
jgi:hypothetical protein